MLQTGLEILLGFLTAMPLGLFLYFMPVIVWASLIGWVAIPGMLIPYAGNLIVAGMNFMPGMVLVLLSGAVAITIWICRFFVKRDHLVFAYTQATLSLAISLPFFYWSIVHHRPMLPFYGQ